MAENVSCFDSAENFEQKHLCVLVLDSSSSMRNESIAELYWSLQYLCRKIAEDDTTSDRVELCVMSFGDKVEMLQEPTIVQNINIPAFPVKRIPAVEEAVSEAIKIVEARKNWYKETGQCYYRPSIILVSSRVYPALYQSPTCDIIKQGVDSKRFDFCNIAMDGNDDNNDYVVSLDIEQKPLSTVLWSALWDTFYNLIVRDLLT